MIYITGDTHGDPQRFAPGAMPGEDGWTEADILIICGDFGYIFMDSDNEHRILDALSKKRYTICFCDGNHENFHRLYRYPEESWNGGRIHRIRPNVIHLMRGHVFTLQGKRFFVMGGAYSIDKYMRKEGLSWWKEELPTNSEYREAAKNLAECDHCVDYVITHTAPVPIIRSMGKYPDAHDLELTGFLEWVMHEVKFEKWFFGHWHLDQALRPDFQALWFDVVTAG